MIATVQSNDQVLKWILLEADMWVDPPLVEQIFIIESSRCENVNLETCFSTDC